VPGHRAGPRLAQLGQLRLPADEQALARAGPPPAVTPGIGRRLGPPGDDRLVEGRGLGRRGHAQLLAEVHGQPLVGQQGRAPVAPAVVGAHQRPVGLLVEGVALGRGRRRVQGRAGVAQGQRRGPQAHAGLPQERLGPPAGALGPGRVRVVLQQLAAVEDGQGLPGLARRRRQPARGQVGLGPGDGGLGVAQVDGEVVGEDQPVAAPPALDPRPPDDPPQPADQRRHVLLGLGRGAAGPQVLDDAVERHQVPGLDGEQGEEAGRPPRRWLGDPPAVDVDPKRPDEPHAHRRRGRVELGRVVAWYHGRPTVTGTPRIRDVPPTLRP
jgi:hypothetical protein